MNYPQYISAWVLDTIFPVKCIECGKFADYLKKEYLCKNCTKKMPIKQVLECIGCKTKTSAGRTCITCRNTNPIDQLLIVSDYNDPTVARIIKVLKYKFIKEALEPISVIIKRYVYQLSKNKKINLIEENPVITCVPMQSRRLNWRGFNQAGLIAQSLADILQLDSKTDILIQIKKVRPQAEIEERSERLRKPLGIFKVANHATVQNKTVIVVDDVCTTGATLNECARVLKESGASKVIGFVIARG